MFRLCYFSNVYAWSNVIGVLRDSEHEIAEYIGGGLYVIYDGSN